MRRIGRRRFSVATAAFLAVCSTGGFAQQRDRNYRVAVLISVPSAYNAPYLAALKQRLRAHGYIEGQNLSIAWRTASDFVLSQDGAEALLALRPDAILAFSSRPAEAALAVTRAVPIVFTWVGDPVSEGIVKEYGRPGGNATGVSNRFVELAVKRLELMRELLPSVKRIAFTGPLHLPLVELALKQLRGTSRNLGFEFAEVNASADTVVSGVHRAIAEGAQAILSLYMYSWEGAVNLSGEEVVKLTVERRVPMIFAESEMVEVGGLISYGTNLLEEVRLAADMLAKVLRGSKPSELPVDQASRFELALNLRTPRSMGIRVPPSVLLRADRVIE